MYKVLIVEDEFLLREGITISLDWENLECMIVGTAENGEEGILKIEQLKPDIVITDIHMPKVDGLKMIDATIEKFVYSTIIMTGYEDIQYMKLSIHYGVCEYILKPVDENELRSAVIKAIQQVKEKAYYREMLSRKSSIQQIDLLNRMPNQFDNITNQVIGYIQKQYMHKITMQVLSEHLHYSESILNKRFKESTGHTINDYLNRYRIQKALLLLKHGNTIADVSLLCGFSDLKYFNIVFKKYIGYTPKEFSKFLSA